MILCNFVRIKFNCKTGDCCLFCGLGCDLRLTVFLGRSIVRTSLHLGGGMKMAGLVFLLRFFKYFWGSGLTEIPDIV